MLTEDQLSQLITENESLQAQVKELDEVLSVREEELELLKKSADDTSSNSLTCACRPSFSVINCLS